MLKLSNISYYLDNKLMIDNLSFSVTENEFLSIITLNDDIKYSLISIIIGLNKANIGDIKLDNNSIIDLKPYNRKIGFVSKKPKLREDLTVYDNIAYELRKAKVKEDIVEMKVDEIIECLDLKHIQSLLIKDISLYQMLKVSLARSIMFNPKVLILDDPINDLDKKYQIDYLELIKKIHLFLNKPAIIYFDRVLELTNKVLTISSGGRKLDYGRKEVVLKYPRYQESAQILSLKKISTLNEETFSIDAKLENNKLIYDINKELFLNNIYLNKFILNKEVNSIEIKTEYITYNDEGNSIKLSITKLIEENDCYIMYFNNHSIIRKKSDNYYPSMTLFYPLDKCIFKDSNANNINSLENSINPALKLNVINYHYGLVRIGNKLINLEKKLSKDIVSYSIIKNVICNLSNDKGIKIKTIKNAEKIGENYYLTINIYECDSDIFVMTNQIDLVKNNKPIYLDIQKNNIKVF